MEILTFPHPSLFTKCQPVTVFGPELKTLLDNMLLTMVANNGVGLAANQVGLTFNMFVMSSIDEEYICLVNPKILSKSIAPANLREGCLSAPGEYFIRSDRASWVEVGFQDETGAEKRRVFRGIQAVCVEHEMEHLEGKGFMQSTSIPKAKRLELSKKWGL